MKIIFSKKIKRKELGSNPSKLDIEIILSSLKKWIFDKINWDNLPSNSNLIKIYMTTIAWARRIVFLVDNISWDVFFLFYRTKNDKIGENISIKNTEFKKKLNEYLEILFKDISEDNFEIIEI